MFKLTTRGLKILWQHIQRSGLTVSEQVDTLPETLPEVLRYEYDSVCGDIHDDAYKLADAMLIATKTCPRDRREALNVVEENYEKLCMDFELLAKYHEELLRRSENANI